MSSDGRIPRKPFPLPTIEGRPRWTHNSLFSQPAFPRPNKPVGIVQLLGQTPTCGLGSPSLLSRSGNTYRKTIQGHFWTQPALSVSPELAATVRSREIPVVVKTILGKHCRSTRLLYTVTSDRQLDIRSYCLCPAPRRQSTRVGFKLLFDSWPWSTNRLQYRPICWASRSPLETSTGYDTD